ncbi:MAG: hypothetical protein R8G34_22380 [Paracoccaceae bacterium]|nr:hypothetical protein [Paracoccaceae bacterium]
MRLKPKKLALAVALGGAVLGLSACDPAGVSTSGAVYYDSVLWNDYYYGYDRPAAPSRPDRPVRPERPDRPDRPVRPSRPIDPGFSRPHRPSAPIHRPAGGIRGRR